MSKCGGCGDNCKNHIKRDYKTQRPTEFNRFEDEKWNIVGVAMTTNNNKWSSIIIHKDTQIVQCTNGLSSYEAAKEIIDRAFFEKRHEKRKWY